MNVLKQEGVLKTKEWHVKRERGVQGPYNEERALDILEEMYLTETRCNPKRVPDLELILEKDTGYWFIKNCNE